jgi:catechol 2,3-dioxygenase-like lactoylglutathione lyase family enzyme
MQLSTVRVLGHDLPAAARFYEDIVGLAWIDNSFPDFAMLGDRPSIRLGPAGDDAEDPHLVGPFTGLSLATHNAVALPAELARKGVPAHGRPPRQGWGGTLLHADATSGNTITFVELPQTAD